MSPCWDCVNKAHCSFRGGSRPCNYYIGPATKENAFAASERPIPSRNEVREIPGEIKPHVQIFKEVSWPLKTPST
jgi:hypothetical protein